MRTFIQNLGAAFNFRLIQIPNFGFGKFFRFKYLRAVYRFSSFFVVTFFLYFIWLSASFFVSDKVHWRQKMFGIWAKFFLKVSKIKLEIKGKIPEPPFFLVCNHLSYTDIPVLRAAANGVFVAKNDVRKWVLLGKIVADAGTVFINRQNKRDIPRAGNEIVERISDGEGVFLFPEGTSSCGKSVLPFNSSFLEFAARADLSVSYCSVSYQTENGEISAKKAVCWFDDTVFLKHLFRFFTLKNSHATITFGDSPVKDTNRKKLASALHKKIENLFTPLV